LRRLEGSPEAAAKADKTAADLDARIKRLEDAAGRGGKGEQSADLDARLKRLEALVGAPGGATALSSVPSTSAAPVVVSPTAPTPPTAPTVPKPTPSGGQAGAEPGGARRAYDNALASYRGGDYQGAITAFEALIKRYPRDALAPNAQYWIGDAWFNLRDFRAAAAAQQALIGNYADSPKVPDAMLNLSSAQLAMGDNAAARKTLEELIARFPQTDTAEKARQRLAKLK
jgi:tol-pal system protein YbgF